MKQITIYTLSDPITNEIRYVGKTKNSLTTRMYQHIRDSLYNGTNSYKKAWIKGLILKGMLPIIEELEIVLNHNCWKQSEQYWIAQLKSWGFNLTNMTDGGDGNQNQIMSLESRIKTSDSLKGRLVSKETRNKISKAHLGKKLSEKTKEKIKLCNLGKKQSEETKAKRYKAVYLVNSNGEIVKEYPSLQHAANAHNCGRGQIANVCRGKTKSACGLIWKYKI
jgi:group I intron endonuclease